jgi:hypothetical protein
MPNNCIECHQPKASIVCSQCRVAVYCSEACQDKDSTHQQVCQILSRTIQACDECDMLHAKSRLPSSPGEEVLNRKKWNDFIKASWKEALRPSFKRNVALVMIKFVLQKMLEANSKLYRSCILLLPQVMIMMEDYAVCHELLIRGRLHYMPSNWNTLLSENVYNKRYYSILDAPLEIGVDGPLSSMCVIDLIFVKSQLKNRVEGLWVLNSLELGLSFEEFNHIGDFLGLPNSWNRVLPTTTKRQMMDLMKLLFRRNINFVPALVRNTDLLSTHTVDVLTLSMDALRSFLVLRQWFHHKELITFLKEISADIPTAESTTQRRSSAQW